jgi:hypothetical protein
MKDHLVFLAHLLATIAKLLGPGGTAQVQRSTTDDLPSFMIMTAISGDS